MANVDIVHLPKPRSGKNLCLLKSITEVHSSQAEMMMMLPSMKVTDDRGVKPACSLLPPLPPSLSLAWEALIPSACNRHPSPFSRGSGAYGREREGRIGSHGEGEGSLNLKDTHERRIIRIATKITRRVLDDVKIDLLLLSNPI